jgi:hypothetical protein
MNPYFNHIWQLRQAKPHEIPVEMGYVLKHFTQPVRVVSLMGKYFQPGDLPWVLTQVRALGEQSVGKHTVTDHL